MPEPPPGVRRPPPSDQPSSRPGPIRDAFGRCATPLAGDACRGGRGLERALARLERSPSAGPLLALARRIAGLADLSVPANPEVVVFLGLLARAVPNHPEPAFALALALAAVRAPKAEQSLAAVQDRFGASGPAALALGRIRLERGSPREALADFERAAGSPAEATQALFGQGLAWLALGEPAHAAQALARARASAPQDDAVLFHLALALGRSGQGDAALVILGELVARAPRHAKAWFETGNLLQDAGRHREAAEAFGRALAAEPSWASAAFNRAVSLMAERRLEAAMDEFGRALRLDPASAGPVAQALTREPAGCLWLEPRRMAQDLSGRVPGA